MGILRQRNPRARPRATRLHESDRDGAVHRTERVVDHSLSRRDIGVRERVPRDALRHHGEDALHGAMAIVGPDERRLAGESFERDGCGCAHVDILSEVTRAKARHFCQNHK